MLNKTIPCETPRCLLSLFVPQPCEEKVQLGISDKRTKKILRGQDQDHKNQSNAFCMDDEKQLSCTYLCGNIEVSLSSSFHIFQPQLKKTTKAHYFSRRLRKLIRLYVARNLLPCSFSSVCQIQVVLQLLQSYLLSHWQGI